MSDAPNEQEQQDAATEAAQNVVGEVTSWEYSAEPETIESRLDAGLEEAAATLEDARNEADAAASALAELR